MNSSSKIIDRRRSSPEKKTLDQCKPEDMLDILLTRIKDNQLGDDKKALLIVELEELRLFFQKHPECANMFRTDLIEWRTFLKQTKEYMEVFFDQKLRKTKSIIQFITNKTKPKPSNITYLNSHQTLHYNRKSHKPKDWDHRAPEPTFYEILFRPGVRSIREYTITEEKYGEHNLDIDQLHKLTAMLREEIIYAPLSKVPSKTKEELLKILISVVQITAYDVLHGILFVDQLAHLVHSISEGEEYRKTTNIVEAMKKITDNIKEHARAVWEKNKISEKQMWDNINAISKSVELGKNPKFDEELLMKSEFLKMEKMKRSLQPPEQPPIIIEAEMSDEDRGTYSTAESSPEPLLLSAPPPSRADESRDRIPLVEAANPCNTCDEYRQKYGDDFLKAMKEPERKFKIQDIPEVEEETETIFKMKHVPKFDYALLRKFTLPTQPELFDVTDSLKTAMRLPAKPETGETQRPEGISYKSIRNPYVNRKRLIKY